MANFRVTESTLELIRQFEGLKLTAYWDYSRYSIGYGSGTLPNGAKVKAGDSISLAVAEQLLKRDATEAASYVNSYVRTNINQGMFDALVSFTYNVGAGNFYNSQLLAQVNRDPYDFAAIEAAFKEPRHSTVGRAGRRQLEAYAYAQPSFSRPGNNTLLLLIIGFIIWKATKKKGKRR